MDCKIISRLFFIIIFFISTHSIAIEFKGKFLQGHYIIGITDPSSKIIIDKKEVKVSEDGYFAFGIDRDRKFDLIITKITNGKSEKIIKKAKAKIIGYACIIDRSNKSSLKIKKNIVSQVKLNIPTYKNNKLPSNLKDIPVTKPGSRHLK